QLQRPMVAGVPTTRFSPDTDAAGRVMIDIKASVNDRLLTRIQSLGGLVINHSARYSAIRAAIPMAQLEVLAAESEVISIRPAKKTLIKKVDNPEGVVAPGADTARTSFGGGGAEVKVGVFSDSAESLAALQASGALPAAVTILPGQAGSG